MNGSQVSGSPCHPRRMPRTSPADKAGHSSDAVCTWGAQAAERLTCKPSDVSMETRYASLRSGRPKARSLFRYSLSWLVSRSTLVMLLKYSRVVLRDTCRSRPPLHPFSCNNPCKKPMVAFACRKGPQQLLSRVVSHTTNSRSFGAASLFRAHFQAYVWRLSLTEQHSSVRPSRGYSPLPRLAACQSYYKCSTTA